MTFLTATVVIVGLLVTGFFVFKPQPMAGWFNLYNLEVRRFNFSVIDSSYSPALNRLVLISDNPSVVHLYEPMSAADTQIILEKPPLKIALSPDGKYAAVAHTGMVSYLDLTTAKVAKTFPYNSTIQSLVLPGNGWIYLAPLRKTQEIIQGLEIATGRLQYITGEPATTMAWRVHPDGKSIYGVAWDSQSRLGKIDVSSGRPAFLYYWSAAKDTCGNLWFGNTSQKLFTACGDIYRTSAEKSLDLVQTGKLEGINWISGLTPATSNNKTKLLLTGSASRYYYSGQNRALPENQLWIYDGNSLGFESSISLPDFTVSNQTYQSTPRAVYTNDARFYAVVQASLQGKPLDFYGLVIGGF